MMDIERVSRMLTFCSTIKHPIDRVYFGAVWMTQTDLRFVSFAAVFDRLNCRVCNIHNLHKLYLSFFTECVYELCILFRI